ncbi:hypothetical protein D6783_02865 [Candidatus Woesearchaeota archaeon]|nr:MAG: hypothetical protein D6783_02865 [Candidatus Woesearchaeota archaeon]
MQRELLKHLDRLIEQKRTPSQIRLELMNLGFSASEVEDALEHRGATASRTAQDKRHATIYFLKECFDRLGYGFGATPLVNILFYLLSQNLFLVGTIVGLRNTFTLLLSSFIQSFSTSGYKNKKLISTGGYLYGFSFLLMALAFVLGKPLLFAVAFFIAGAGLVIYGDLSYFLMHATLRKERAPPSLRHLWRYGIFLSAAALFAATYLLDAFPIQHTTATTNISLASLHLHLSGYTLIFLFTAISFIISGFLISLVKPPRTSEQQPHHILREYAHSVKESLRVFRRGPYVKLLFTATLLTGLVHILGSAFYGIFIYETFKKSYLLGFLNVGIVYAPAVLLAFIGPYFSRKVRHAIGLAPTLVFGTLLTAFLPAVLYFKPLLPNIVVANGLAVIGSAMVGVSQDLLAKKILHEKEREHYYRASSSLLTLPYLILIPLGAYAVQEAGIAGMGIFFAGLAGILAFLVAPLYFILVALGNKERL